jgi:hypothetical protein
MKESCHVVVPANQRVECTDRPQLKSLQRTPTLALVLPQPIPKHTHGLFTTRMQITAAMAVPFLLAAPKQYPSVLTVHLSRFTYTWTSVALRDASAACDCLQAFHLHPARQYLTTRTLLLYILAPRRKDRAFLQQSPLSVTASSSFPFASISSVSYALRCFTLQHCFLFVSTRRRTPRHHVLSSHRTVLGLQVSLLQARHRPMPRRGPTWTLCAREDGSRRVCVQQSQQPSTRSRGRLGSASRLWVRQRRIRHTTITSYNAYDFTIFVDCPHHPFSVSASVFATAF